MKAITLVLFVSVGLLPFVPSFTSPISIFFSGWFIWFAIVVLWNKRFRLSIDNTSLGIIMFVFVVLPINVLVGLINDIGLSELIRGAIPFIFLLTYILFCQLSDDIKENIPRLLLVSAATWAISTLLLNFSAFLGVMQGNIARLTYSATSMLIPFGLVGLILLMYEKKASNTFKITFLVIFILLIVTSGYRSQLGLTLAAIAFRYRSVLNIRSLLAMTAMAIIFVLYFSYNPNYLNLMLDRIRYSSGDDVRYLEIAYAWSIFKEYPIFGGGVGYPVPIAVTRPLSALGLFEVDTVPYIHNFSAYILMGFGSLGLGVLLWILSPSLIRNSIVIFSNNNSIKEAAWICLSVLIVYFHVSASFRQIQMWIVVSALMVVLKSNRIAKI